MSPIESQMDGKRGISGRLRGYFLAGILVTAPIAITIYLTYVFFDFIDSSVKNILPLEQLPLEYQPYALPGAGIVAAILFFMLIGWFATNILGRLLLKISDYILHRMPVMSKLYGAIQQIVETIMASQSQAFRDVVMLEYPRKGTWSIGFVTGTSEGEVQSHTEVETINVFVPTTPNPTSGFLLFVPRTDLKYLDMNVEEGIKLVVSAGIITPKTKGMNVKQDAEKQKKIIKSKA
jgi:uncharacterized membrane protein